MDNTGMKSYRLTLAASYLGYIVQAITINFAPLLFVTFRSEYKLSLSQISSLIVINFVTQLIMDVLSSRYVDKLGYRICAIAAQAFAFFGVLGLAVLPDVTEPFFALAVCMVFCGIGGGLIEVIINPIVEALPMPSKSAAISMLHSFYSWGYLLTVLGSTLFFAVAGLANWRILSCIWAAVPLLCGLMFIKVPIYELKAESEEKSSPEGLLKIRSFRPFLLAMICAGAAEQAVSQWASAFAESGLGVDKAIGDLLGPSAFALLMGAARLFYALMHEKLRLLSYVTGSTALLLGSYLLTVFAPFPALSLVGCALCGLAVGILWPGILSLAGAAVKNGGTAMFALLAFCGDVGCITGPAVTGFISDSFGGQLRLGYLVSALFPLILLLILLNGRRKKMPEKTLDK